MKWTDVCPTEDGFYWQCDHGGVTMIVIRGGFLDEPMNCWTCEPIGYPRPARWSGPIAVPESVMIPFDD